MLSDPRLFCIVLVFATVFVPMFADTDWLTDDSWDELSRELGGDWDWLLYLGSLPWWWWCCWRSPLSGWWARGVLWCVEPGGPPGLTDRSAVWLCHWLLTYYSPPYSDQYSLSPACQPPPPPTQPQTGFLRLRGGSGASPHQHWLALSCLLTRLDWLLATGYWTIIRQCGHPASQHYHHLLYQQVLHWRLGLVRWTMRAG